jgi:hypothetical protein
VPKAIHTSTNELDVWIAHHLAYQRDPEERLGVRLTSPRRLGSHGQPPCCFLPARTLVRMRMRFDVSSCFAVSAGVFFSFFMGFSWLSFRASAPVGPSFEASPRDESVHRTRRTNSDPTRVRAHPAREDRACT